MPLLTVIAAQARLDLTNTWIGYLGLVTFLIAYLVIALESKTHLRKSKPVMVGAGMIWLLAGIAYARAGDTTTAGEVLRRDIGSFGELFLFILCVMTFVNTMEERQIFGALRSWLIRKRLSLRAVFWATGILSFFISSQIDNMTTALVMGTVVLTVGRGHYKFLVPACINVVVAANVLHATRDLRATVDRARSLLAPGGLLVLSETTRHPHYFDITTGLIEGWQSFDDDLRADNPLIGAERWVDLCRLAESVGA